MWNVGEGRERGEVVTGGGLKCQRETAEENMIFLIFKAHSSKFIYVWMYYI